jgi:putative ABC transport system permease protein
LSVNQSLVLSAANVRSIPTRAPASLVAILGFAGVTAILVVLLSAREGVRMLYTLAGRDEVAIVTGGDSTWEGMAIMPESVALNIVRMPGIARDKNGPVISQEFTAPAAAQVFAAGSRAAIRASARGVTAAAFGMRRDFRLLSGRRFGTGKHEVIVGRALAKEYGLHEGEEMRVGRYMLKIVGVFAASGSVAELEAWTDKPVLQGLVIGPTPPGAPSIGELTSSIWVRLDGAGGLERLNKALADDQLDIVKRLHIRAQTERSFWSAQSKGLVESTTRAASAVGLVMGIGALFGAINTMYAAVAHRSREIATLRALGFQSLPIASSVMAEALMLSLVGALIGWLVAALVLKDVTMSTFNEGSGSPITLSFMPTSGVGATAVTYALALGLLSSVLPCLRALRGPIPAGLFAR